MPSVNNPEQEIERLSAVIVPYICERTGLQASQVEAVMNALETFWDGQPHVIGLMFINGVPLTEGDEPDGRQAY